MNGKSRKRITFMATSSSVLVPPGEQHILVIIAHPDDAESFSGGTMARLAAEGKAGVFLQHRSAESLGRY
jgi:hypothetical protein